MINTMLNEGEAVSRGARGRQRNPNFSLPIDDAQAGQLMADLGDQPSMLDEARLDLLEGYTGQVRSQKARDMRGMYTDPVAWWKSEGNDNVPDEVKHEIANRRFVANAFGQTPDEQGDLYPSFRDQYFDQTFGKAPANESEAFTMLQKGVMAQQQTEQAISELPATLALNLMRAAAGGTEVSEAASYDIYQEWKDRHADVLAALPEDWESRAMEQAESLRVEMDTMMRDIAPEAKKVWDILQKFTRPEKTYTGDEPPQAQGRRNRPSQRDTQVDDDTPVSREDIEGVAKALAEMPEDKQQRLLEMLYMSAEATGAGMGRGFFEKVGEGLVRGGVRIYEEGVMASEDRTARYNLTRLKRGETLYEMADGVVGTQEEIARLASSGNYNATKLLADPSFQAGTGNVNEERRGELLDANEQRLRELSTLRKIRNLASSGIDPLKTEMTGIAGSVIQGAYDYSQSAAYTVMAGVPFVGFPAVAVSLANTNYLRMLDEYPDIDPDFAWNLSLAIGAPQAFVERFKVNALMGRSPMLNKLMKRMTDARVPIGGRIAIGYGANVAYQTGQEFVQEAMPTMADQLAAAIREDMPEFEASQAWGAYVDEMPQIFFSMLWAGLIGTGAVSLREFKRDGIFLTNVGELEMVGIVGDTARDIAAEQDTDARNEKIKTAWGQRSEADIKAGIAKRAAMLQAANATDTRAGMPQRDSVELQDGTIQHTIRDSEGNVLLKTTDSLAADVAYIGMVRQITSKEFNNDRDVVRDLVQQWEQADPNNVVQITEPMTAEQKLAELEQAGNTEQIAVLHRRIAQSGLADTPLDQINILGEATVQDVGDMVFRGVIALNANSRPQDAREEIHHVAVRRAVARGDASLDQLRSWLADTENILEQTFPRETLDDIVESIAVVQRAFEDGQINAAQETGLPPSFVDYIKRMITTFAEVLKRAVALRQAFQSGALTSDYEAFLAQTTGADQQSMVDAARDRTSREMNEAQNYSIGALGDQNPFIHPRGADGKYKGAPKWVNAPETRRGKDEAYMRLRERLYQLVQEGAAGRFWYEDSGRAVLRMFNNNVVEAEKFIELLAIYSPQATVEVNTYFALRAYIQRAVNAAKKDFAVKTGAQDDKAKSVLYDNQPWAGRKTDNFYKNIMYVLLKELPASEVAKLKLDAEVYEMLQKPVTVDMWVYRAFGFDSDALTDVAGTGAFGFAERELNLIAEELNALLPESAAPYLPHQIQAMLWTSIKGRSETKEVKDLTEAQSMKAKDMVKVKNAQGKLVREFKDKEAQKRHMQRWITNALALPADKLDVGMAAGAFDRFINSVSMRALWESVPSTNTPEGVAITNLPTAQKAAFTRASRDIILDENGNDMLAAMLGVPVNVSQLLSGGYGTGATPNVVTELFPNKPSGTYDDNIVRAYARAIQYIYRQDAVPWMRYIKYGAENERSYYAESPKGAKRRFATQAEAEAYAVEKEGYVVKGDAENFATMLNFGEQLTPEFLDQLQQGLVKVHESLGFTQVSPTEVIVTNFRDSDTGLPALTDEAFYESLNNTYGQQADISELYTVGEYGPVHNWAADPEGGSLLQAGARFTPDLLEWLRGRRQVSDALQKDWAEGRGVVSNYSIGSAGATLAEQLKELQAGESAPVDTDQTFWLIASSSGDIVDILDNEQDATIYFQTTASTSEWLWEYKDGLRTQVPLLKRGVAERRADGYIDTVRQEQENAGRVFYDGADTSAETTTSAGEIPSYTPDGQPWAGQEESVVYHGGRLLDPQGTDQSGYGETQTLKPRRPYQTYLYSISTQSEIDRVTAAMDKLTRGPDARTEIYHRAKDRMRSVLGDNWDILRGMEGTASPQDIRRTQILQTFGVLDAVLKELPTEVRGKIGFTDLAKINPVDVLKDGQKISESNTARGGMTSAWMREGMNIGQAQKQTAMPQGYSVRENLDTARADKAIVEALRRKFDQIDRALERSLRDDYREKIEKLLKSATPQKDERRILKGRLTPEIAALVEKADALREMDTGEVADKMQELYSRLDAEKDPDALATLTDELTLLQLFGDFNKLDSMVLSDTHAFLSALINTGRDIRRVLDEDRSARMQAMRDVAVKEFSGGQGILAQPAAVSRGDKRRTKKVREGVYQFHLKNQSFEWLLNAATRPDKTVGTLAGKITQAFSRMAHRATHQERRRRTDGERAAYEKMAEIFGVKVGMPLVNALYKFKSEVNYASGVSIDFGRRTEQARVPVEVAQRAVAGEANLGFNKDELKALRELLASNAALPQRNVKSTLTLERVLNPGTPTELALSQDTALYYYMLSKQDGPRENLELYGWSEGSFAALEKFLQPQTRAIEAWLSKEYYDTYFEINAVYREIHHVNLSQVINYSPVQYEVDAKLEENLMDNDHMMSSTSPSFVRGRVRHRSEVRERGALDMYFRHLVDAGHYISWALPMRDMRSVLGHKDVQRVLNQQQGSVLPMLLNDKLDQFASGGRKAAFTMPLLDAIRSSFVIAKQSFNWGVMLKQLTSFPAYMYDVPFKEFFKYEAEFWMNPLANTRKIASLPFVKQRFGEGFDRDMLRVTKQFERLDKPRTRLAGAAEYGMIAVKFGDIVPVITGGYAAYRYKYEQVLAETGDAVQAERDAVEYFEMVTERAQQAGDVKDLSFYQSGGSVARMLSMFKTAPRQYYSNVYESMLDWKAGKEGAGAEFARRLFIGQVVLPIFFQIAGDLVRNTFREPDERELDPLDYLRAIAVGPLNGLFVFGGILEAASYWFVKGRWFDSNQLTGLAELPRLYRSIGRVGTAIRDGEINGEDTLRTLDETAIALSSMMGGGYVWYDIGRRLTRSVGLDDESEELTGDFLDWAEEKVTE